MFVNQFVNIFEQQGVLPWIVLLFVVTLGFLVFGFFVFFECFDVLLLLLLFQLFLQLRNVMGFFFILLCKISVPFKLS